jgi:membrane associated rhomboid family serine protease
MIPFRDDNPSRSFPIVTVILIALNVIVWLYEVYLQSISDRALETFIMEAALVPYDLVFRRDLESISNIFTSMFMHGDWLHIGGNMLYLWIFGDNIEDTLGKPLYVLFYLGCGIVASLAHVITGPESPIPTLGASGAIAGVLGAYLILFPQARVQTLLIMGRWISVRAISALWVLGFWFVLQLIQGVFSLGGTDLAGVAYWAHIGGFVAGVGMMALYATLRGIPLFGRSRSY